MSPILSPNEKPSRINYRARQTKYNCVIKAYLNQGKCLP